MLAIWCETSIASNHSGINSRVQKLLTSDETSQTLPKDGLALQCFAEVPSIGKYVGAKFLQTCGAFVSVFMRPQTALKSDPSATMRLGSEREKALALFFLLLGGI